MLTIVRYLKLVYNFCSIASPRGDELVFASDSQEEDAMIRQVWLRCFPPSFFKYIYSFSFCDLVWKRLTIDNHCVTHSHFTLPLFWPACHYSLSFLFLAKKISFLCRLCEHHNFKTRLTRWVTFVLLISRCLFVVLSLYT